MPGGASKFWVWPVPPLAPLGGAPGSEWAHGIKSY